MNPEERARYLEGNTFFSFQKRSKYPDIEYFADLSYYEYEEVAITTLQMGDVILLDELGDIPFWTPSKITNSKITFSPCALKKVVDWSMFGYTNYSKMYQLTYKREPDNFSHYGNRVQWGESGNSTRRVRTGGNGPINAIKTMNKQKILRNGERQEIRVRKYTGTDEDLKIFDHDTAGTLVRDGVYTVKPDKRWDAHLKRMVIIPYEDDKRDETYSINLTKKWKTPEDFDLHCATIRELNHNWKFEILPNFENNWNPYINYPHMEEIPLSF
jgi:uncharacterized protein YuzE